jgi:hypothetical protein
MYRSRLIVVLARSAEASASSFEVPLSCWYFCWYLVSLAPRYQQMLSDVLIRSVKRTARPRKLSDTGGLHLLVAPNGGRYWRFSYRFRGKQKTLASALPIRSWLRAP